MATLDLVPVLVPGRREMIRQLEETLARTFQSAIRVRNPWFNPEQAFDVTRGQYSSTRLLRFLLEDPFGGADRVLGVCGIDLFTPVLTFVFGEAQLEGRAAVVSIHRLRPEAYGLPVDEGLVSARLEKESVHELGHTFGLVHCSEPDCVMHASTYVEDVDLKTARFCSTCLAVVRGKNVVGSDR